MTLSIQRPKPKYYKSSRKMLDHVDLMRSHAETYLSAFQSVDPGINAAFLLALKNKISTARDSASPDSLINNLKVVTDKVKAALIKLVQSYKDLLFYVKRAFPGQTGMLTIFGKQDLLQSYQSAGRMLELADRAYLAIQNNMPDLNGVGFTNAMALDFTQQITELRNISQEHAFKKGSKLNGTDDYYNLLNEIWADAQRIHAASQLAFRNDPVKLKLFMLYPEKRKHDTAFTKVLPAGNTVVYYKIRKDLSKEQELHFKVISGRGKTKISLAKDRKSEGEGVVLELGPGEDATYTFEALGGEGNYLRLSHESGSEMRVRVILPVN